MATSLPGNTHLTASGNSGGSEGNWETPEFKAEK